MDSDGNNVNNKKKVEMFFFPYLLGGHLLPMIDAARFFSSHPDVRATIITTPRNAQLYQAAISRDRASGCDIEFHTMELPTSKVGLPQGFENLLNTNSTELSTKLLLAVMELRDPILDLLRARRPDCLVSDMFHPWTVEVAREAGVPRIKFHIHGLFALCAEDSLRRFKPHEGVSSDDEVFLLPGLPDQVGLTRMQLPQHYREESMWGQFLEIVQKAEEESFGVIVNSFYELEGTYADYFKNVMGRKMWAVGPESGYSNRNSKDKAERGGKNVQDEERILEWLEAKEKHSVLYVSFGSQARIGKEQCHEIALGLERAGCPFLWVARTNVYGEDGNEGWFPEGFEERVKGTNQGLIIQGWAPQLLVLGHPSVGAFMTHCGWNSTIEGISNGVPLITWPLTSEQFFNESLLVDVLKIGVRVGNEEWMSQFVEPKVTVRSKKVEAAVRRMMGGGEEVEGMRTRVKEYGEKAKMAVQEGGSSHSDVYALVAELKARQTEQLSEEK